MTTIDDTTAAITSVEVGLGAVCNLLLILVDLVLRWKQWRQVKWYVVLLTVGNMLEVAFNRAFVLGWNNRETWTSTRNACRFLVFVSTLGPVLANMALAALALHVLLTSITGNQGNRRRHALVLGLFVLLSLPQPLSEVDMYDTRPVVCKTKNFLFTTRRQRHDYDIGIQVTTVFFPLFVFLVEFLATLAFNIKRGVGGADVRLSDSVLVGILGLVAAICCVPLSTVRVYMVNSAYRGIQADSVSSKTVQALTFLSFARPILTAIVCVVFGYVVAFCNPDRVHASTKGDKGGSIDEENGSTEEQKLVN